MGSIFTVDRRKEREERVDGRERDVSVTLSLIKWPLAVNKIIMSSGREQREFQLN